MTSKRFRIASAVLKRQLSQTFTTPPRPITEERERMEKLVGLLRLPAGCTTRAITVGNIPAEWLEPPTHNGRILLYLHGGAYCLGSITTHRAWVALLACAAECRVLMVDYRLAPEHPFPAALDDSTAVYHWLLAQGHQPEKIAIGGDSAGGGLTVATLVNLRDMGHPLPRTAVCISPWVDLAGTGESMRTQLETDVILTPQFLEHYGNLYLAGTPATHPLVSPLYADLHGLPPLLIQVGGRELLRDDGLRLAESARTAGVDVTLDYWPEMIHVWHSLATVVPEGKEAIERIAVYLGEMMP
jgi:acetyl esterase/lipase